MWLDGTTFLLSQFSKFVTPTVEHDKLILPLIDITPNLSNGRGDWYLLATSPSQGYEAAARCVMTRHEQDTPKIYWDRSSSI